MIEKKLKSGRKVLIKEMSVDTMDMINDMMELVLHPDGKQTFSGISKQQTAYIRHGLGGGDFNDWKPNGGVTPDSIIKQMSKDERDELRVLIEEAQVINPSKPSN